MARAPLLSVVYHLCSDRRLAHVDRLFPYKSAEAFARDLAFLRERFTPVGHDQVVAHFEGRSRLPPNAVEISFDDGLSECFSIARPLLLRYGIPATFFCITNAIDNRAMMFRNKISLCLNRLGELSPGDRARFLEWMGRDLGVAARGVAEARRWMDGLAHDDPRIDALCARLDLDIASILRDEHPYLTREELRQLGAEGFTLGAHTCNHPRLERLPWSQARREILESCAAMRELTGQRSVPFAIPFGGPGGSRGSLASLLDAEPGISLVYDTNGREPDHPCFVNRIQVDTSFGSWRGRSNLGLLIARARLLEPLRAMTRRLRPATAA